MYRRRRANRLKIVGTRGQAGVSSCVLAMFYNGSHNDMSNRNENLTEPERIFRGGGGFLIHRLPVVLALGVMFSLVVKLSGNVDPEAIIFLCLCAVAVFLQFHLIQEVGTSSERFWFKSMFRWYSIPFSSIDSIEEGTVTRVDKGLLVYSEDLSFLYWLIKRMGKGRKKGRAVFVTRTLVDFKELKLLLDKTSN